MLYLRHMKFSLKAKNITLTDAIRAAVEKKLETLDKKATRFGESVTGEVEVGKTTKHHKKGELYRAEIHVRLPGKLVYAESTHADLYGAIGEAAKEAAAQITSYKGILAAKGVRKAKKTKGGRTA